MGPTRVVEDVAASTSLFFPFEKVDHVVHGCVDAFVAAIHAVAVPDIGWVVDGQSGWG